MFAIFPESDKIGSGPSRATMYSSQHFVNLNKFQFKYLPLLFKNPTIFSLLFYSPLSHENINKLGKELNKRERVALVKKLKNWTSTEFFFACSNIFYLIIDIFLSWFLCKSDIRIFVNKTNIEKRRSISHSYSDKRLKVTIVNLASNILNGEPVEIKS